MGRDFVPLPGQFLRREVTREYVFFARSRACARCQRGVNFESTRAQRDELIRVLGVGNGATPTNLILAGLSYEDWQLLKRDAEYVILPAGETLARPGQVAQRSTFQVAVSYRRRARWPQATTRSAACNRFHYNTGRPATLPTARARAARRVASADLRRSLSYTASAITHRYNVRQRTA